MTEVLHKGGCHCGAVQYEVLAPSILTCVICNCSICDKKQNTHFIVPLANFTLLKGDDVITTYTFNTRQAKHTFCKICGVQSFYYPRSNPDGVGIMPHCLDKETVEKVIYRHFDGENWEDAIKTDVGIDIQEFSK